MKTLISALAMAAALTLPQVAQATESCRFVFEADNCWDPVNQVWYSCNIQVKKVCSYSSNEQCSGGNSSCGPYVNLGDFVVEPISSCEIGLDCEDYQYWRYTSAGFVTAEADDIDENSTVWLPWDDEFATVEVKID